MEKTTFPDGGFITYYGKKVPQLTNQYSQSILSVISSLISASSMSGLAATQLSLLPTSSNLGVRVTVLTVALPSKASYVQ